MTGLLLLVALLLAGAPRPSLARGSEAIETIETAQASQGTLDLARWAQVFTDPGTQLTLDTVRTQPGGVWHATRHGALNFGYDSAAHWVRLRLHRTPHTSADWLLGVPYPLLDEVQLHVARADGGLTRYTTGDRHPFTSRPLADLAFWFPIHLQEDETVEVYLRVQGQGSLQVPLLLATPEAQAAWQKHDMALQGLLAGTVLAMLLLYLVLALTLRERLYAYYVLHLAVFGAAQVALSGMLLAYLWPTHPAWHHLATVVLLPLAGASMLLFSRCFLRTAESAPRIDRLLQSLQWGFAALALGSLALPYAWVAQLSSAAMVLTPLLLLAITARLWWRGVREARYFLAAVMGLLLGTLVVALHAFGMLGTNTWTTHGAQWGAMLEAILLGLALADRLRLMRDEQARLQARYAQELESQVQARTHELNDTLHRLTDAHTRLQALAQQDPLTGLKNRAFLNERLPALWRQAQRDQHHLSVLMIDIDLFKHLNDRYGHAAGDEALRQVGQVIARHARRPEDHAVRYGGEEFLVILPQTHAAGAAHIAEALRADIEALCIPFGQDTLRLTVSIGVAGTVPRGDLPVSALVEAADRLLYQAKREGRNRCAVLPGALSAPPVRPAAASPVSAE